MELVYSGGGSLTSGGNNNGNNNASHLRVRCDFSGAIRAASPLGET